MAVIKTVSPVTQNSNSQQTTALSEFPNVETKREERRNCLKHVVGRIDDFSISPTGFPLSSLLLPRFYFFALLFTSHRSPLSERLEQVS